VTTAEEKKQEKCEDFMIGKKDAVQKRKRRGYNEGKISITRKEVEQWNCCKYQS
jgi:hypothetical protein